MTIILNVNDNRAEFFMELIKKLDYIRIIKEVKTKNNYRFIEDMTEAFHDVREHEQGKKKLKSAKDLLPANN